MRDGAQWEEYWTRQKTRGSCLYGLVAAFYRRFIFKGALNHFLGKYFPPGAELLHAGCGSGEVDIDISRAMRITALDLSNPALQLYRKPNGNRSRLVRASVFQIPLKNEAVDGVYNLSVMEHFTEEEIHEILLEFHRVLKRGKTVIFWPPECGLSVAVLKVVHFILNGVLKRDVRLHPDELTRARSKAHAFALPEKAGFEPGEYYFGLKDIAAKITS